MYSVQSRPAEHAKISKLSKDKQVESNHLTCCCELCSSESVTVFIMVMKFMLVHHVKHGFLVMLECPS